MHETLSCSHASYLFNLHRQSVHTQYQLFYSITVILGPFYAAVGWLSSDERQESGERGERQRTAGVSQTCTVATCHTELNWRPR